MQQNNSEESEPGKRAAERVTERSSAYPSVTIEYIVGFVSELKKAFQKTQFKREDIMSILNRGSSTVNRDVSAAVQYGLVDKTVGTGYKLTQLTEHILQPISPEEKVDNIADCFRSPKLYSILIDKFKGEVLPTDEVLKVILVRHHGITSNAAPQAVEIFVQNAEYAGLLNSQRVLMPTDSRELAVVGEKENESSVSRPIHKDDVSGTSRSIENESTKAETVVEKKQLEPPKMLNDMNDKLEVVIHLSEKKIARLTYPSTIKARDIQILKMQIDLLELTIDT